MSRDLSVIGRALAAPTRSAFLNMLMDGSTRPASELATSAGVSASTASEHLGVLLDAGIVTCLPRGRQRFYRIADAAVAGALEQLGHMSPPITTATSTQMRTGRDLARARLCYDHLAGRLGIRLVQAWTARRWIDPDDFALTADGVEHLMSLGIDIPALRRRRRPVTRPCPDWTERRPHLAGSLGATVASHCIEQEWVSRRTGGRGLDITRKGDRALRATWGVDMAGL